MSTGVTVVIIPTVALVNDFYSRLDYFSINSVRLTSENDIVNQSIVDELKFLLTTPENFLLLEEKQNFYSILNSRHLLSHIFFDEAHCLEKHALFRPAYNTIRKLVTRFSEVPLTLLSATLSASSIKFLQDELNLHDALVANISGTRNDLRFKAYVVQNDSVVLECVLHAIK